MQFDKRNLAFDFVNLYQELVPVDEFAPNLNCFVYKVDGDVHIQHLERVTESMLQADILNIAELYNPYDIEDTPQLNYELKRVGGRWEFAEHRSTANKMRDDLQRLMNNNHAVLASKPVSMSGYVHPRYFNHMGWQITDHHINVADVLPAIKLLLRHLESTTESGSYWSEHDWSAPLNFELSLESSGIMNYIPLPDQRDMAARLVELRNRFPCLSVQLRSTLVCHGDQFTLSEFSKFHPLSVLCSDVRAMVHAAVERYADVYEAGPDGMTVVEIRRVRTKRQDPAEICRAGDRY